MDCMLWILQTLHKLELDCMHN